MRQKRKEKIERNRKGRKEGREGNLHQRTGESAPNISNKFLPAFLTPGHGLTGPRACSLLSSQEPRGVSSRAAGRLCGAKAEPGKQWEGPRHPRRTPGGLGRAGRDPHDS